MYDVSAVASFYPSLEQQACVYFFQLLSFYLVDSCVVRRARCRANVFQQSLACLPVISAFFIKSIGNLPLHSLICFGKIIALAPSSMVKNPREGFPISLFEIIA